MTPGLLGEPRDLGFGDELAEGPLDLPLLQKRGGAARADWGLVARARARQEEREGPPP